MSRHETLFMTAMQAILGNPAVVRYDDQFLIDIDEVKLVGVSLAIADRAEEILRARGQNRLHTVPPSERPSEPVPVASYRPAPWEPKKD